MLHKAAEQSDRIIMKLKNKVDINDVIRRTKGSLAASEKHLKQVKEVIIVDVDNNVHVIK